MTDQSRENTGKFSWPGFIAGLLVGAFNYSNCFGSDVLY